MLSSKPEIYETLTKIVLTVSLINYPIIPFLTCDTFDFSTEINF
ncbi:hypothetical protein AQPE_1586 [Aquipluma nitroreducens]|uniref:Uncharacterized protein n=1 Tax=Aquipluma nitroreducens TaxID=2010828 RepID=A0A5K7S7C4_9BACT|nr:hypothetical protein AQPE_1586 [Aquipluma nitroreducens]